MTLLALASVKASPGVTTTAALLAGLWPGDPLLVEADPSGGDLAAWFGVPAEPGMVTLAAAGRRGMSSEHPLHHARSLPGGVQALLMPPGAERARGVLTLIPATVPSDLRAAEDMEVIADLGRLDPGSAATAWAHEADLLVVVIRPRAAEVVQLAARADALRETSPSIGVVVVGDGAVEPDEVEATCGFPVVGSLARDEPAARHLRGEGSVRSWGRSALVRSARALADRLVSRLGYDEVPRPSTGAVAR